MKKILETERLTLREFCLDDVEFVLKLVNTSTWLEFIGDRGVNDLEGAKKYLEEGPMKSYANNGFGLWLVASKHENVPLGMCGLIKRDTLEYVDIGFAMLPDFAGKGYGFEVASATMNYARNTLNLNKVIAITDPKNNASIALLNKIGLRFEKTLILPDKDQVLVFAPPPAGKDLKKIDRLTDTFFDLFTNKGDSKPKVNEIKNLFIPEGRIISNTSDCPEVYDLDAFISPREKILTDGTLTEFSEREVYSKTDIYRNVAQRFSFYEKSGVLNGKHFESRGVKTLQFVKLNEEWKMSSVAWSDEN